MAKCNQLTSLPFKGLKCQFDHACYHRASASFGLEIGIKKNKEQSILELKLQLFDLLWIVVQQINNNGLSLWHNVHCT